jgi:carboxypeptidase T
MLLFLLFASLTLSYPDRSLDLNAPYHYYTYQEMTELFQTLAQDHPDIMTVESLGTSYEGRNIWLVKLSDNVEQDEDEPGVLLMGAHHGNEKPSFEILIYFIEHMIEYYEKPNTDDDGDGFLNEDIIDGIDNDHDGEIDEDPSEDRVREVLNNTQIFLIPMVSPDGVEANSRKNCAPNHGPFGLKKEITSYGVNLNRNYGYRWFLYYIFPHRYYLFMNMLDSSPNYRGPYPFSEYETQAVKNFVESHDVALSLSFHSYGEFLFFPWTHTSRRTLHEDLFISIGDNISRINKYDLYLGKQYLIPRFGGTLGTSENWLYGTQGILSYTVELCRERAPSNPSVVFHVCLTHVGVNLYVCERSRTVEEEKSHLSLLPIFYL